MANDPMQKRQRLRRQFAFWSSIRPGITITASTALLGYFFITFWLKKDPERFVGANALSDLVIGVSLSILAAFIFYTMDVHVKEFRARTRVNAYIGPLLKDIMRDGLGFVHSLDDSRALNSQMAIHYKVTDIIRVLKQYSKLHANAHFMFQQNYYGRMVTIKDSIKKVLVHYPNLDPDLIDVLNGMLGSYMFMRIETFDMEEELTTMADPVLEFLYWLRDLHKYTTKHIPSYLEAPTHPDFALYELYQQKRGELRVRRRAQRRAQ